MNPLVVMILSCKFCSIHHLSVGLLLFQLSTLQFCPDFVAFVPVHSIHIYLLNSSLSFFRALFVSIYLCLFQDCLFTSFFRSRTLLFWNILVGLSWLLAGPNWLTGSSWWLAGHSLVQTCGLWTTNKPVTVGFPCFLNKVTANLTFFTLPLMSSLDKL